MADRNVRIVVAADVASAIRGLSQVSDAAGRVGDAGERAGRQSSSFGDTLKKGLELAGVTLGLAGVAASIKHVVSVGMSYEDNMNEIAAVNQLSAQQMGVVSARAQELGSDLTLPATSAADAAGAMLELSKGGMSVSDSMSAARGTLLLAAAASISGAEAATLQSNALNSFQLSAGEATHVADLLANTANAAAGSAVDVGEALTKVGGIAHQFGVSIEDTATGLGIFAKNGVTGAEAGTLLRGTLTGLNNQSKPAQAAMADLGLTVFDASGKFVGMRSVSDQLAAAQGRMTTQAFNAATQIVFGNEAMAGAAYLAAGAAAGWDDMSAAVNNGAGVQAAAASQTKGLSGAFDSFMSAVDGAAISLYTKYAPALTSVVAGATALVGGIAAAAAAFTELPGPVQAAALALGAVVLLNGPLKSLWVTMSSRVAGIGTAISGEMLAARLSIQSLRLEAAAGGTSMGVLSAGMRVAGIAAVGLGNSLKAAFLSNPIGIALVAATTALTFFMSATGDAAAATSDFTGAVDENTGALTDNAAQVVARTVAESGAAQMYKDAGGNVADYTAALTGNADKQALVIKTLTDAAKAAAANAEATNAASGAATSYSGGLGSQEGAFRNATGALQTFRDDLAKVNEAQDKGKLTAEGAAGATDAVGGAAAKAASPMDQLKTATEGLNTAASLADAAVQFLTADLDAAAGGAISAEQATRLNEAAFRGIADAARGYQAAQDGVTEAGLKVKEAQDKLNKAQTDGKSSAEEISQAQLDLAAANRDNEAATGKVAAATDTQFNANIQARDSALKLASSAYATAAANGNLQGAVDSANAVIEDQRTKFINAQVAAGMEAGAATNLATKLFGIPGKVGTDISEKGGDAVILQAQNVTRYLQGVPNSKVISIDAAGNAQAVINGISVSLANMQSYKQVVVETIQRSGSNAAVANGGAFDVMADGGMVHAAAGLITGRGQSQVRMGAGGGVTWAEGITGKEYYLSMKPGMQDRNRGLASQAVSDLGGQAVWGGDVRTGAGTMSSGSGSQPINLTLTLVGDGPITEAALGAAQVTVDNTMRDFALSVVRQAGQGT